MYKIWLITQRELKERIASKGFILLSILGPLLVLLGIYFLFVFGGKKQQKWNVLITDPVQLMENRIMPKPDPLISYHFYNDYLELEEFKTAKRFKKFDAMLEVNEKVISNKVAFLFYKEKPSFSTSTLIQFQFERRLEEIMIKRFTSLSIQKFREVKQPINIKFKNVFDPYDESDSLAGYAGFFFGLMIFLFILFYGSSVMRSVARDKSNRVVEVILASSKPKHLLSGKILGVGISALIQFGLWSIIIGLGLVIMRDVLFPDIYDASKMQVLQTTKETASAIMLQNTTATVYNDFVSLVFDRLSYTNMIFYFILFFIGGYLFYASLFATLGAVSGSETDGQQFNFILVSCLLFSLYAGYDAVHNPEGSLAGLTMYLPFTSPVVALVRLAQGFQSAGVLQLLLSLLILFCSSFVTLWCASRWFKHGILNFGHRLKFSHFLIWFKK
jgi:ABC-2 type transport system permease protein